MRFDFFYQRLSSFNTCTSMRRLGFILGGIVALIALCSDVFDVIGNDSILYIQTAEIYKEFGFQAAFDKYNWPAYSILIAWVHAGTGFTLINSAYFLNFILVLILADAFFRLYWEVFPECKFHWIPLVIFLAYSGINDYRAEIIRDWGFWAFAMLAFLYFIRAYNKGGKANYFFWQICMSVALIFRVEAVVFMLMLPLFLLFSRMPVLKFIQATSLFWGAGIVLLVWFGLTDAFEADYWGKLGEIAPYFDVVGVLSVFKQGSLQIAEQVFPHHADSHAVLFMVAGLLGVLSIKVLAKLGYLYLFMGIAGWFNRQIAVRSKTVSLVLFLIFVCLFIVFVFFAFTKVLAGRYIILASLLMLVFIAYFLEQVIIYCLVNNKKSYLVGLMCLLLVNFIVGITHSGSKKIDLKNIGIWTDRNIPGHARVLSNEVRLCFYSNRQSNCHKSSYDKIDILNNEALLGYDYLLWRMKGQESVINTLLSLGKLKQIYAVDDSKPSASAVLYKIVNS